MLRPVQRPVPRAYRVDTLLATFGAIEAAHSAAQVNRRYNVGVGLVRRCCHDAAAAAAAAVIRIAGDIADEQRQHTNDHQIGRHFERIGFILMKNDKKTRRSSFHSFAFPHCHPQPSRILSDSKAAGVEQLLKKITKHNRRRVTVGGGKRARCPKHTFEIGT